MHGHEHAAIGFDPVTGARVFEARFDGAGDLGEFAEGAAVVDNLVLTALSSDGEKTFDAGLLAYRLHELVGDPDALSLLSGGTEQLELRASHAHAGEVYVVVGSASGTDPGFPVSSSVLLPLNYDGYTQFTVQQANTGPLVNTHRVLDAHGKASAAIVLPAGTDAGLAGTTLHHAFVSFAGTSPTLASNPVALLLEP